MWKKICLALGIDDDIIEQIMKDADEEDDEDHADEEDERNHFVAYGLLDIHQRHALSLARAIIANPEVLCLDTPTACQDEVRREKIWEALPEFVKGRGLHQPPNTCHQRRPRTCVVSVPSIYSYDKFADDVFEVEMVEKAGEKVVRFKRLNRHSLDSSVTQTSSSAGSCSSP